MHVHRGVLVGHPGIVPECPCNYGTRDTQRVGLHKSSSWTSRFSPGVSK